MKHIALITGITGQDGSYLSELLLSKQYIVYGIVRRTSSLYNDSRLSHLTSELNLRYGDMSDGTALSNFIHEILTAHADFHQFEIYNLAAQSHVAISFQIPEYTGIVDGIGTLKILDIVKSLPEHIKKKIRIYQAGTSEMYGRVIESPQNETTPFNPVSPYAAAKVYSHYMIKVYREAYGIFACNGILFNHESPRRGHNFLTMKVVNGVKDIMSGKRDSIQVGNLHSKRDWGHAKDYVRGMWLMLQHDKPDDYVLATNTEYTVKEFIDKAFAYKGICLDWSGEGVNECAKDKDGIIRVEVNEKYFRPCEVDELLGDPTKAVDILKWEREYTIQGLIEDMFSA